MGIMTGKIIGLCLILAIGSLPLASPAGAAYKSRKTATVNKLYIQQGKKITPLTRGGLTFRTVLTWGEFKSGLYGIPQPPSVRVDPEPLEIYLFDPNTAGERTYLSRLHFVESSKVNAFDLAATRIDPAMYPTTYSVNYEDVIAINLWGVEKNIPLQICAVAGKPGWYRLVPQEKLESGNYALNYGCLDGPRVYTGDQSFYPFLIGAAPPPPVAKAKKVKGKRRVARKAAPPAASPPASVRPPGPPPIAREISPPGPELAAALAYDRVNPKFPRSRREYRVTNLNEFPWHNVNVKIYVRSDSRPDLVLGPVTAYKDVVLPAQALSRPPDQTFLHYETLEDEGYKIYLDISCKEGGVKKAWKNVSTGAAWEGNLAEIPWDLKE